MSRHSILLPLLLGCFSLASLDAGAASEVVFVHGKTMEIESYRQEGNAVFLRLPGGGEMAVMADHVVEIRSADGRTVALTAPTPPSAPGDSATAEPGAGTAERRTRGVGGLRKTVDEAAARHGVDPELVRAIIQVESAWDPRAVSPAGAMGLMQLMPATVKARGVTDPFDPVQNIEAGVAEIAERLEEYAGELSVALAAYNAGGKAVSRYEGIPPYRETMDYVQRVLNLYFAKTSKGKTEEPSR